MNNKSTSYIVMIIFVAIGMPSCNIEINESESRYEVFAGDNNEVVRSILDRKWEVGDFNRIVEIDTVNMVKLIYDYSVNINEHHGWMYEVNNSGDIVIKAELFDSVYHGRFNTYYENGNIRSIGYYKYGLKDSTWFQFHNSGVQVNYGSYKNDLQIKTWYYYDTLKREREVREYNGNTNQYDVEKYNSEDILLYKGTVVNELPDGKWIEYGKNGNVITMFNYHNGKLHDSLIIYNDDNKPILFQLYDMDSILSEGEIK